MRYSGAFVDLQAVLKSNQKKRFFFWFCPRLFVPLPPYYGAKKERMFMFKAVKYNSRKEALAAFKKMIERKKDWVERTEQEFTLLRQQALK